MRKILLSLVAISLTLTASAAIKVAAHENAPIKSGVSTKNATDFGVLANLSMIKSLVGTRSDNEKSGIIEKAPEGKLKTMLGSSMTFYIYYDQVTQDESYGVAYESVWTDSGDVYLKNPVSMLDWDTYIKGTVTEEGIKFDFPQIIYSAENGSETYDFYVDVLEFAEVESPDDPDDYISTFVPATDTRSINFVKKEDGSYAMEGEYMLGITYDNYWQGYGEMELNLLPFEASPIEVPEGIEYDYSYILADELNGWDHTILRPIGIGEANGVTYISGISDVIPSAVITAEFDKVKNTLTIPTDQFLGKFDNHYVFMMVGAGYSYYDDLWEENMISFDIIDEPLVFNYNPEKNVFTPIVPESNEYSYLIFNFGNTMAYPIEYYAVDRIYSQGVISDFTPVDPEVIFVSDINYIDPEYSYSFEFNIFPDNAEGQILPSGNIYYNIYLNRQLVTFSSDEYPDLMDAGYSEITDIPYGLNVGSDIYASGNYHGVALTREDIKTLGVRAVYINGDTRAESAIITVNTNGEPVDVDNVLEIGTDHPSTTEYFDMTGRKVSSEKASGIIIKRTLRQDGTKTATKIVSTL